MQGFSLQQPFKVNCTVSLYKEHRKLVLEAVKEKPSKWMYANVDADHLPTSFLDLCKNPLEALNLQCNGQEWREVGYGSKPDMPYGRGSIGTHIDEITGVTMLILLFCEPWVQRKFHPEYNGFSGEFISNGKVIEMKVGDAIIFDDRQPHAWLTNSAWAFATFPLSVQTRL
jgi:hypothetical protein